MADKGTAFIGRAHECQVLQGRLDEVRAGRSGALVLRGEAGIGKTTLLQFCGRQATGCRVIQIAGIETEHEIPLAAVHQLCQPVLRHLSAIPEPQADALRVAFGIEPGAVADRFAVGLAVLSLLSHAATEQPLVCLVDDAQWLDEASAQVLGFVGRRLLAEAVLMLFAVRESGTEQVLPALPDLMLKGLSDGEARALLTTTTSGHLDPQVRDRIVAETRGNPHGLLELSRAMTRAELAGGFGAPTTPLATHVEAHYIQRVRALPEPTQQLMLVGACDSTGNSALLWRAAKILGIGFEAAAAALDDDLLEIRPTVHFRHPLVRSAAYAAASIANRRLAHLALAEATDRELDPDRRVWHLAAAAAGPDEETAAELERMASRAQARAGLPAAATFLQRSVALTPDPVRRVDRSLAAAHAHVQAGAFDVARGLLAQVEADAADDLQRARAEQLRGQVNWAASPGREAPVVLLQAAKRLEPLDASLARETYLHAWLASSVADSLVESGGQLVDVSRAVRSAAEATHPPRPCDLLLDGLAAVVLDRRAAAEPQLRLAVDAFLDGAVSSEDWLRWGFVAQIASIALWDVDSLQGLSSRHVEVARASEALAPLAVALTAHGMVVTLRGDFDAATAVATERSAVLEVTGIHFAASDNLLLAGYRGRPADALPLFAATEADATARGEGFAVHRVNWSTAILYNGLGQYAEALAAAEQATDAIHPPTGTQLVLPELIEAAARLGERALAQDALNRLSAMTAIQSADWAAGLEARCRALVNDGSDADHWYTEAIERLRRTPLRPDLARSHLLYGEWLRHENRRLDARQQLREAYDTFAAIGAEAFAERARRELVATGEKAPRHDTARNNNLTRQEEHIAHLARDGRTNPEIGAELFLSARTIEWHLRNVFTKLGITSRKELKDALPPPGAARPP